MVQLICGIRKLDGKPVLHGEIAAMLAAMTPADRPSAAAVLADGPVGFGIVSISPSRDIAADAPSIGCGDGAMFAGDMRLYDGPMAGAGPGQLLERFLQQGPDLAASLHGDFACAIWDGSQQRLLLARDHFGVRPLQFTVRPGKHVAFASLPGALLKTGLASRSVSEPAAIQYAFDGFAHGNRTLFRDIECLKAAHAAVFDPDGTFEQRRHWRVPMEPLLPFDLNPKAAAAEIARLLEQAVARRLPESGPGAGHMSGGLDSTAIAVMAARHLAASGRRFLGYSFQEKRAEDGLPILDERPFVEAAAAGEPNIVVKAIHSNSWLTILEGGVDPDTGQPVSLLEPEEQVLADAAANGASILFSGWGGDQVVTQFGQGAEAELLAAGRLLRLARHLVQTRLATGTSYWTQVKHRVVRPFFPARLLDLFDRARNREHHINVRTRFIHPQLRGGLSREIRPVTANTQVNRRTELEAQWIPKQLELFAQAGARHGLAYSFPMLDLDLVAYAMRIPGILFRHGGIPRSLFRESTIGILPDSVRLRIEKLAPYPAEMLRTARERPRLISTFRKAASDPAVRHYLDPDAIVSYLENGRTVEEIESAIHEEAATGVQANSQEDQYEFALQFAFFLQAQARENALAGATDDQT